MRFTKMEGLGNDYIYVNCFETSVTEPEQLAIQIADRHFGVGSDGLVLIAPSDQADVRMIMYNADGSRGQMCGNASRCVGKYVYEKGIVHKDVLTLETDNGIRTLELSIHDGKVQEVSVDMGIPIFDPEEIPCAMIPDEHHRISLVAPDRVFEAIPVNTGNPHAVIFLQEPVEDFPITHYGPILESAPAFPLKANIEFVQWKSETEIRMRVWERGSGLTMACGTGACAAYAASVLTGQCKREGQVHMDGGRLGIRWDAETDHLWMTGPAQFICEGEYLRK